EQFRSAPGVDGWTAGDYGAVATFSNGDFATGAKLFARIAELGEAANHHPDVRVTYPSVSTALLPHTAGASSAQDADLAQQIDAAARELAIDIDTDTDK